MMPHILKNGMITAVGLNAPTTAAAIRAGVHGTEETGLLSRFAVPHVMGHLNDELLPQLETDLTGRWDRMLRLAVPALHEATAETTKPLRLFLALPEASVPELDTFVNRLMSSVSGSITIEATFPFGRASGLMALAAACDYLAKRPEERVLVGGVDSYLDPELLDRMEAEQRLPSPTNHDGFIPGEAAAFIVLGQPEKAGGSTQRSVVVQGVGQGSEPGHLYSQEPCLGEGLCTAMTTLFATSSGAASPASSVFLSFNGESFWAKEWGVAAMRHSAYLAQDLKVHHPAEYLGDCGAALSVVCLTIASIGLQRGYLLGPTLITASSDGEQRGAALLGLS